MCPVARQRSTGGDLRKLRPVRARVETKTKPRAAKNLLMPKGETRGEASKSKIAIVALCLLSGGSALAQTFISGGGAQVFNFGPPVAGFLNLRLGR